MERFDQGHLHLKLEVPGLTCSGQESNSVGGKHSRKEPFEQLIHLTILIRYNLWSPQLGQRYEARVEIVAEQEQEFLARLYQYLGMGLLTLCEI
jgi:hypothetical protein